MKLLKLLTIVAGSLSILMLGAAVHSYVAGDFDFAIMFLFLSALNIWSARGCHRQLRAASRFVAYSSMARVRLLAHVGLSCAAGRPGSDLTQERMAFRACADALIERYARRVPSGIVAQQMVSNKHVEQMAELQVSVTIAKEALDALVATVNRVVECPCLP